jgi:hypothetical protein
MFKTVLAATAAIAIAGSSVAYAQRNEGKPDGGRRWQPNTDDIRAFQAARLAALRAGLVLTSEQEKHWPAFEQAMREIQQQRLALMSKMREARRDGQPQVADPAERMRQRAARLSESGAALKKLADAVDPLYRSLDEAQKRRFAILSRMSGQRGGFRGPQWRGQGGEQDQPRGQRRTDVAPNGDTADLTVDLEALIGKTLGAEAAIEDFGGKRIPGRASIANPPITGGKFGTQAPAVAPTGAKTIGAQNI